MRIETIVSPVSVTAVCLQHNLPTSAEFVTQNRRDFVTRITKRPRSVKQGTPYVYFPRSRRAGLQDFEPAQSEIHLTSPRHPELA
jgi:hypothetical protein